MISMKKFQRIKNLEVFKLPKDFRYNVFSFIVLGIFLGMGITFQLFRYGNLTTENLLYVCFGTIVAGGFLTVFPLWLTTIQLTVIVWIALPAMIEGNTIFLASALTAGFIVSPAFQLVHHWDKVVILRFGRFRHVKGPGLFLILPLADRIAAFVDTRIRATDFSAEKTLTMDTVPVHVDALTFWMIWDAKRAILEVANFTEAIILSAQTALRDAIGKHNLADLLSERERLGKEIRQALDNKTNPWGITILSIEITDILIPPGLEDAMSRRAQAERESQSRIILGTAEVEVSKKFEQAAERYRENPTALHLRAMNIIYDGLKNNNSIMLLPSTALESMSLGTVMGAAAIEKTFAPHETGHAEKNQASQTNLSDKESEK